MSTRIATLLGASAIALAACAQKPAVDTAAIEGEMQRIERDWIAAYNAGDMETVMAAFAADAVVMPPQSPAVSDSAELRKLWTEGSAAMRGAGLAVVLGDDVATRASADIGWQGGSYAYKTAAGQAEPGGNYLGTWEIRDGKWLIVRFMWTPDHEPPAPAAIETPPAS